MLFSPGLFCSQFFHAEFSLPATVRVNLLFECPVTAPRPGESCVTLWCTRMSMWRKPAGGSTTLEPELKIVAEASDHPSRCRWTTGKRASSRDARDTYLLWDPALGTVACLAAQAKSLDLVFWQRISIPR